MSEAGSEYRPLAEARGLTLRWAAPRLFAGSWELRDSSGNLYARLLRLPGLRFRARLESVTGVWNFAPRGWWRGDAIAVPEGGGPMAVFRSGWWFGGTVTLEGGRVVGWRRQGLWRSWRFERESLKPLIAFRSRFPSLRASADLELDLDPLPAGELAMLAGFGWYLMLRLRRRGMFAAGGAGSGRA